MSKVRNFFPIVVRLAGRRCLVVGAGKVAAEKIAGLLQHDAEIVVVSPRAEETIQEQARDGKIAWRRRRFASKDVDGAFLVVAATSSPAVNRAVFRACSARGVLCNAVDDPKNCDFFYPAVVRRGPLQIAISTNGKSPALASRLRKELEQQFGPEWSEWVEHVGKQRSELLKSRQPSKARRERLLKMATSEAFQAFVQESGNSRTSSADRRPRRAKPHGSRK